MTAFTDLAAVTFTAAENTNAAGSAGYPDAQGILSACNNSLAETKAQLTALAAALPSGTNKTKVLAAVTALA